ncbi:ferritin [Sediminihabitans luteus]|uniref:Ferritin n=1 Tax=Sediminihabitans luteus TaxID=1138585 RepID=A0A2M9CDU8_9CELL|nr:ferritin [Sediminihabitans luteus]PJJ70035.1 ferritin [Sediminihabitans luteus]GIJ00181.1 ferritin [Sediminihabitans luteus]
MSTSDTLDAAQTANRSYLTLLQEQVGHELDAHQQYVAIAVWFDANDLPRLAAHFYRQAIEERNHAMMIVQYMLDRDIPVTIPGTDPVRNDFLSVTEPLELALAQEKQVTDQIEAIFRAARAEGDAIGEQFMLWFLKEQVEEVASANTLLTVARRAGDNLFDLENFVARETIGDAGESADAPEAAGGAL